MKRRKEMRLAKIIYVVAQNVRVSFFTSKFVSPVVNLAHNWPASDVPLQATVYLLAFLGIQCQRCVLAE